MYLNIIENGIDCVKFVRWTLTLDVFKSNYKFTNATRSFCWTLTLDVFKCFF